MSKQFYFKQFSLAYVHSLNVKTILFQTIQFSICTQFSSIWPIDRTLIRCYHSKSDWTREWCQWRGTLHFPKLQHYWNLTIRLFSVISRTLIGGGSYHSTEIQSVYSTTPADRAIVGLCNFLFNIMIYLLVLQYIHSCWVFLCQSYFNNHGLQLY